MNRQIIIIMFLAVQASLLTVTPHFNSVFAAGNSSFDLDLKELKRAAKLPTTTVTGKGKQKTTAKQNGKKPVAGRMVEESKKQQVKQLPPKVKTENQAKRDVTEEMEQSEGVTPAELTLQRGDNPCQLAGHIAVAVGRSVPPAELLHGLPLEPVAAISNDDLKMLVVCRVEPARLYTFERLLQLHNLILVNIDDSETAEQVAEKIINQLGLCYRIEDDRPDKTEGRTWFLPENRQRIRPLRLTVRNE